jgi:hypothetical protein
MKHLALLIAAFIPAFLLADVDPGAAPTAPAIVNPVELRLKPASSSPVVLTLPEADLAASSQDAGYSDGRRWQSVERPVTLTGYVDKAAIDKDLEIAKGAVVWVTPDKTESLTTVDNPEDARLLEVDHMGKVEVKEPRVLYYTTDKAPAVTLPVPLNTKTSAPSAADTLAPSPVAPAAPLVNPDNIVQLHSPAMANDAPHRSFRTIEGVLKKGNPLLGGKLYLVDAHGVYIAKIDRMSPIAKMTIEEYLGETAVYTGELREVNGELVLTVRSIRME